MPDKPQVLDCRNTEEVAPPFWPLSRQNRAGTLGYHLSTIGIGEMACLSIPMCLTPISGATGLPE